MPYIPPQVAETDLSRRLASAGLTRIHQGKVRDTYELPGHPDLLLVVATDRISIFDFVLNTLVSAKGNVLTAMTVFWLTNERAEKYHHMRAYGSEIDQYLPENLRKDWRIRSRALVVRKYDMVPVEAIVRGYLTGTGWKSYQANQTVCGISLPEGLHDGAKLPEPIFTPTTKAEVGHDEHLKASTVTSQYGDWLGHCAIRVYNCGSILARDRGIIIADTKFEYSTDATLCDEVLTPDSSRFWRVEDWEKAVREGKAPSGYDKEGVRQWGKKAAHGDQPVDISKLNPESTQDLELVEKLRVPSEITSQTTDRYLDVFERLTGMHLLEFQTHVMHIHG
jgi:phosphoribosylaminoimidazole-succinocarboxamide synthase